MCLGCMNYTTFTDIDCFKSWNLGAITISWPHLAILVAMVTLPETNSKSTWKWMVGIGSFPFGMAFSGAFAVSFREGTYLATVDGRNPAPVDMVNISLLTVFHTYMLVVVVWDFWTINGTVLKSTMNEDASPIEKWWFSNAMLVYQRVPPFWCCPSPDTYRCGWWQVRGNR